MQKKFVPLKRIYRVLRSVLFATILTVAGLYVLIYVAISLPWVQDAIRRAGERELSTFLRTKVSIGGAYISPSGEVHLTDVNVPTPEGEKCAYIKRLAAGIDLWELLLDKKITITYTELIGLDGHLVQKEKGAPWNIQFIIDACKPKRPGQPPTKFDLRLSNVVIRRSAVSMDLAWKPHAPKGKMDFNHLKVTDLRADLTMPVLKNDDFLLDLRRLSLKEQSGFELTRLTAKIHLTKQNLDVEGLRIELPGTQIAPGDFHLSYDGYADILPTLKKSKYDIRLHQTRITPADFSPLLPMLERFRSPLELNLMAEGTMRDINIHNLQISGENYGMAIALEGRLHNPADAATRQILLRKLNARFAPGFIDNVLACVPGIPESAKGMIKRLQGCKIDVEGNYSGKAGHLAGTIETGIGGILTDMSVNFSNPRMLAVKGYVRTPGFNIGSLLDNDKFGNVSADAEGDVTIAGKDINGSADVTVRDFFFKGHNINNLTASVTKSGNHVSGNAAIDAAAISLSAEGEGSIDGKNSIINASASIAHLDPAAAGIPGIPAGYAFSGNADVNINGLDPATATGSLLLSDIHIDAPRGPLDINHITVSATNDGMDETGALFRRLLLDSDFFDAEFNGHFDLAQMPRAATALVAEALPSLFPTYLSQRDYSGQNVDFTINIHHDNTLTEYFNLPVRLLTDVTFNGNMDGDSRTASLDVNIPYLQQGKDKLIRQTFLSARLDGANRSAMLNAGALLPGKDDSDIKVGLNATGIDDNLRTSIAWDLKRPKDYKGNVDMEVNFDRNPETGQRVFAAHIIPSTFEIADTVWNIGNGTVRYSGRQVEVQNLSVWHADQYVNIYGTASSDPADVMTVDLSDIDLNYIFETLNINYVTFGGRATGKAVASSVFDFKNMVAQTDGLKVKGLRYNGGLLGDADLTGRFYPREMKVGIGAEIADNGRHCASIDGGIWINRDSLGFNMNTDKVDIKFLQPFMQAFTSEIEGRASGNVNLYGTFKDINMRGRVFADTIRMKVDYTNCYYAGSDSVIIDPGVIRIPSFRLYDKEGNSGILTGEVHHDYFHNPSFRFDVRDVRNMLCYNTDAAINPDWYGKIYGSGSGSIVGRPGYVGIFMDMDVAPRSVFTFVLNDTEAVADYEFLTFSDRRADLLMEEKLRQQEESADTVPDFVKAFRRNKKEQEQQEERPSIFELDLRAEVTPSSEMVLVMDPVAGDKIRAHGNGALQLAYKSDSDELTMYGKYTLTDGMYNFSLQDLILKDFTIRPGSNISFNGDPLKAILDITAAYRVNSNLADLDKSFATDRELNRTNVPVDAILAVSGDLEAPEIKFDVEFPTLTSDVTRKVKSIISTDDMMSRQILYLLALNRFYTPEYMGSQGNGGEWASVASATVTGQLTNMLSQLTDKLSIAPSLRSDKGDFSDMEVDVALSSRLLNNRLLLNGNFGYRDKNTSNTTFIGDFDIEYLLNSKGNLRLKAYNHFNDQNYYLKSALTTQGIGVVYRKEFDNPFKFLRRKKKKSPALQGDSLNREKSDAPDSPDSAPEN